MRPRFLAVLEAIEPGRLAELRARLRDDLPVVREGNGHVLFLGAATPALLLPECSGFIVGDVIRRTSGERMIAMPEANQLAIWSTCGGELIDHFWGGYAAYWRDGARGFLLRDPSGVLPVHRWCGDGPSIVFSDLDLAIASGLMPVSPDWEGVAGALLFPALPTVRSAVTGIGEVLPGTRVDPASPGDAPNLLWRPWDTAERWSDRTDLERAEGLAAAVDHAVAALVRGCGRVLLELSGGLDSSIVAAALARSNVSWSAINMFTAGADGDERRYARDVASMTGAAIAEIEIGVAHDGPLQPYRRLTTRPRDTRMLAASDTLVMQAVAGTLSDATLTGLGGDNVFFNSTSTAPLLDAWRECGTAAMRRVAADVATLAHVPITTVYGALARRVLVDFAGRTWPVDTSYLARSVRRKPDPHPWLGIPRRAGAGRRAQIASILRIHGFLDGVDRFAARRTLFPLLSQPVMEACLAMPSWSWVAGGQDRALARTAFHDRLPQSVLRRRGKGNIASAVVGAFERSRGDMRELLCDGALAAAGMLDRDRIARDLARPTAERLNSHDRLMQIADAELWVQAIQTVSASGTRA